MNRFLLVVVALLLVSQAVFAYDLNATEGCGDMSCIGATIVRGSFSGDYVFFSIIMITLFALFIWQAGIPAGGALGIGLILLLALAPMLGATFTMLFNLILLAIGVMIALAILKFIRR